MSLQPTLGRVRAAIGYSEQHQGAGNLYFYRLWIGKKLIALLPCESDETRKYPPHWQSAQNARRLAACWNACEGLHTESLERNKTLGDQIVDALNQRDELLEALKDAREHIHIGRESLRESCTFPDGSIECGDQALLDLIDKKLARIDSAIAKAEVQ